MIDPRNITIYGRTQAELEEYIIFCVLAAGKTSSFMAKLLHNFLLEKPDNLTPFEYINTFTQEKLAGKFLSLGCGCYNGKARTIKELVLVRLDLRTCDAVQLKQIWGISDKTANFFILHSRPGQNCGVVDTHVQKYVNMSLKNYTYTEIEKEFLKRAAESGKTAAELDLEIWNRYAK